MCIWLNKKISVFRVTGLKILGRVTILGRHIIFFWKKNIFWGILKGNMLRVYPLTIATGTSSFIHVILSCDSVYGLHNFRSRF